MSDEIKEDKMVQARGPHGEGKHGMQNSGREQWMGYSLKAVALEERIIPRECLKI
jgi:hypothetical protein